MEQVCECKIILVHYICDKCNNGKMIASNDSLVIMTNPPQFPHICEKCGEEKSFTIQYPYQKLVPVEPLRDPTEKEK